VSELASSYHLSEDEVVARALDLLVVAVAALDGPHGTFRSGSAAGCAHQPERPELAGETRAQTPEDLAKQRMLAAGLLTEIRSPPAEVTPFAPIAVQGKPLSELIIEERR
jgi:hypothetical protein